jgi:hypothetical protein
MSRENVPIIERMYSAWLRDGVFPMATLDPGLELDPHPGASLVGVDRVYRGHDGIREYLGAVPGAVDDSRPGIKPFLHIDDNVVTLAVQSGRGRGSGAEVQST